MKLLMLALGIFFVWILIPDGSCAETETNAVPSHRISVAILPLEDLSGDTNAAHWRTSFPTLLQSQLVDVRTFRVLPQSSIDFGFRESGLKQGQALSPEQVRLLGKRMEASYVFWGSYKREAGKWRLSARLISTATPRISEEWSVSSTNWLSIEQEMIGKIIHEMGVTPTPEEERQISQPVTSSPEALELMIRGVADFELGKPLFAIEIDAHRATVLDPASAEGWFILGTILSLEGKFDEAKQAAERAIELNPQLPEGHGLLGKVYQFQRMYGSAEAEFLKADTIAPDRAGILLELSDIYSGEHKWDLAAKYLERAEKLEPYRPAIHAGLGRAYAHLGDTRKAFTELTAAERFTVDDSNENLIGEAYNILNATPEAVEHLEKYVAFATKRGMQTPSVADIQRVLPTLNAILTPHFITAQAPPAYTSNELQAVFKAKLSPAEYSRAVNPLVCTPEMKHWAEQLTTNTENEMDRAKKLFYGITRRVSLSKETGDRTAVDAFNAWPDAKADFSCQEFTFLYLALARSIGVKACFCAVMKDYRGMIGLHACAAVFLADGKVLLVDPRYGWFGIPHQEYTLLDDRQVAAVYLSQLQDVAKARASVKLAPELPLPHYNLAILLAQSLLFQDARREMEAAPKSDSFAWFELYCRGAIDLLESRLDDAEVHLRKSLDLNPDYPKSHFFLGQLLLEKKQPEKALAELKASLQSYLPSDLADDARSAIAYINNMQESGK